jgi:ribosome maturation factor RimP
VAKDAELKSLLEPAINGLGYEFWGLELIRARGATLRVYIDRDGGVGLADCEAVSRELSSVLDVHDPIKSGYTLEVSSPGLDRPLFTAAQFEQFAGHQAKVALYEPLNGRRKFDGSILGVDAQSIRFEQDGQEVRFEISNVRKANLVPDL